LKQPTRKPAKLSRRVGAREVSSARTAVRAFKLRGDPQMPLLTHGSGEHANLMRSIVEEFEPVGSCARRRNCWSCTYLFIKQVGSEFIPAYGKTLERGNSVNTALMRDLSSEVLDLQSYIPLDEIPTE